MLRFKKFLPRSFLGVLLWLWLAASLAFASWNAVLLATSWTGSVLVNRTEAAISKTLTKLAAQAANSGQIEEQLAVELDGHPRDWVVIDSLEEILTNKDHGLSHELAEKLRVAREQDFSLTQQALDCAQCSWNASSCEELSSLLACRLPVELTAVGDIQDLWRASDAYYGNEEVDTVNVALSVVGLGTAALTVSTLGASTPITGPTKVGASALKLLHRAGKLPVWMQRELQAAASKAINWKKLSEARSIMGVKAAVDMRALKPAINAASDFGYVYFKTGARQTAHILESTSNAFEFRQIATASKVYENRTVGYLKTLGNKRVVRATLKISDEVYGILVGFTGVFLSLLLVFGNAFLNFFRRKLRRRLNES